MMTRHFSVLGWLATLVVLANSAQATKITFDGAAASANADIPLDYGSYIAGNSTGFITTDGSGATPNIGLTWLGNIADEWEYHTATTWQHEFPVHVAQMDHNRGLLPYDDVAEVLFTPIDGRSVRINSFLLTGANDSLADATFDWEVVGTAVGGTLIVPNGGNTGTVPVNFTGAAGASYTLRFTHQPGTDTGFGTALDDLSFSEVLLPGAEVLRLIVDRATGGITLKNVGTGSANIKGYSITSESGALNYGNWKSIAGNYDVNGNGSVDVNDDWTKLSSAASATDFSEYEFGGNGATLAANASVVLNVASGNAWLRNPTEDLQLEIVLGDGRISHYSAEYINGPAGGFAVGDLNFDGSITALDWPIYNAGRGVDLSGMSLAQAYQKGDLDGDLDNDISDFVQFKALFTMANGAGSFEALFSVPEPMSVVLLLVAGVVPLLAPRRITAPCTGGSRAERRSSASLCVAMIGGTVVSWLVLASSGHATTITFALDASGNVPANNSDLSPTTYGSNIAAGTPAFITSDGSGPTPNIGLTWAPAGGIPNTNDPNADVWEYHSSTTFQGFGFTVPVMQMDVDASNHTSPPEDPTIDFTVTGGFALKLNSLKIGNATDQSEAPYRWIISLTRLSDMSVVASHTTGFLSAGTLETVAFNYTGDPNESYRLRFDDEGANRVRTAIDDLSFSQVTVAAPKLKLIVNTLTGAVTLANDSGSSFNIDSYEIRSASSSLDPAGWNSLQDQDYEGGGAPGTGSGWEEAGGVGAHQLIESYLLGSSLLANGVSIPLGRAFDFDKIGVQQDLEFLYHATGTGGILRSGIVEYVQIAIQGDYNRNGVVDAADYVVWRDTLGSTTDLRADGDGNGVVQQADYAFWRGRFGSTSGSGSGAQIVAVPEPGTMCMVAVVMVGLVPAGLRRCVRKSSAVKGRVSWLPAILALIVSAQSASAVVTVDRYYRFGEHPNEPAAAGSVVGSSLGETLDSMSQTGSRFDSDAQNLTPNSTTLGPKYVNVGPTGLNRPGTSAGQFGAQFDGSDDRLVGVPLNRPDETAGPDFVGIGPLLFPFPYNYDTITARGLQMWVYPDAAGIGGHRQGIVFDTIAAGGVSITADGKWTQTNDSRVADTDIPATVPVVGNQWYHVMQHIYPTAHPGAPTVLRGIGAPDRGFTSVVYVNGVAVSVNNGTPTPGELDDGGRIGVLVVGAEEVASLDTVTPEFTNHFRGVVDDLKMYVFGDNSTVLSSPPGQNYGTFNLFVDNDWIASQIALIPGGVLKPGDVNRDGSVNQADVAAFASGWTREKHLMGSLNVVQVGDWETWGWGDLNLDGVVNFHDAVILDQQLMAAGGSGLDLASILNGRVPEPASLVLASIGMMAIAGRRRRTYATAMAPSCAG